MNSMFKIFYVFIFSICFISCSQKLSEKEIQTIEKYTKHEAHDSSLYGKWMNDNTFTHNGKVSKIAIFFDEKGINNERMYVEEKPFNEWHLMFYYYTKDRKIFYYRPAEKGFLAMDSEIFHEYEYKLSDDGKSLMIGNETYTKME